MQAQGAIFGTSYHVSWFLPEGEKLKRLENKLEERTPSGLDLQQQVGKVIYDRLDEIDGHMSHYRSDSELSRLNNENSEGWIDVSPELMQVLRVSREISTLSGGAFDITVAPLVELWGFGKTATNDTVPEAAQIEALLLRVGMDHLELSDEEDRVRKRDPALTLNLSAVAKGFAVDAVAELLEELGISRYLVEIGGEVRVLGPKPNGEDWRIAIESPHGLREVYGVLPISQGGLATSGDYRNYFEQDGKRYSHTLDPRTGYPISHALASVSVLAEDTARADAWATALMVLGPEAGQALTEEKQLSVFMIIKQGDGFSAWSSSKMAARQRGLEVLE